MSTSAGIDVRVSALCYIWSRKADEPRTSFPLDCLLLRKNFLTMVVEAAVIPDCLDYEDLMAELLFKVMIDA